jgi:hypothetical protein
MSEPTPFAAIGESSCPSTPPLDPAAQNAAVAHCLAVFKGTYRAEIAAGTDRIIAYERAGKSYRRAMPALVTGNGVDDFIACAAHAVLIGAIDPKEFTALLYAVQVVVSRSSRPKPGKSRKNPAKSTAKPGIREAK